MPTSAGFVRRLLHLMLAFLHPRPVLRVLCRIGPLLIGGLLGSSPALAQTAVGRAYTGLPGLYQLPIAEVTPEALATALSVGYGMTEPQPGEAGSHHRVGATAALGVAPIPPLQLALQVDGRYDQHPPDRQGQNSGSMLSPTLSARWIERLDPAFALGAAAALWLPGTESMSGTLAAASPQVSVFGTWRVGDLALASLVGYRFDRSSAARPDVPQARLGDRIALGLSDFDAAQLGLGAGYWLGQSRLFAELNADVLLGSGAPPFLESPLTASVGARRAVNDSWSLELIGSVCLSKRPPLGPNDPLVPIDPRFSLLAGARFQLPVPAHRSTAPTERAVPAAPLQAAAPELAKVELSVQLDPVRPAIATATLSRAGRQYPLARGELNRFVLTDLAPGNAVLQVSAPGYQDAFENIVIPATGVQHLQVALRLVLQAQIRGLVRSLAGGGLVAHIIVQPLGIDANTDADGFFELDVAPGSYSVSIEAEGYRPQRRAVVVERDGVVILNTDLLRGP